jgi:hypothetical protein
MGKIERSFPLQVGVTICVLTAVAAYPLIRWGSAPVIIAAVVGGVVSTGNVLLGFLMIEYAFEKSYTTFLKVVLGGMGLRMGFMLAALLILILWCRLHAVALTVSVLVFTMAYLVLEIFYLQRKVGVKNQE